MYEVYAYRLEDRESRDTEEIGHIRSADSPPTAEAVTACLLSEGFALVRIRRADTFQCVREFRAAEEARWTPVSV